MGDVTDPRLRLPLGRLGEGRLLEMDSFSLAVRDRSQRRYDVAEGNAASAELLRLGDHQQVLNGLADGGDFGHSGDRLERRTEEIVLQLPQRRQEAPPMCGFTSAY